MANKIKTLIVDDSALVRQALSDILNREKDIEVIGTASDPYSAVNIIKKVTPDVIILDIEMPKMDGLTFLKKIMSQHPIPVIICSSYTVRGSKTVSQAIEYGALEIMLKPQMGTKEFLKESQIRICDAVRSASHANLSRIQIPKAVPPKFSADVIISKGKSKHPTTQEKVIVIGASTGGTQALTYILQHLPVNIPGIVVVQHMPEKFTESFANRLNDLCKLTVTEAKNNDIVESGNVYIAPGNTHTLIKSQADKYKIELKYGPLVCRHRPSVDVLFRSAARYASINAIAIILTGMGDDGTKGMLELKEAGALNIAQNKESCVVYGMPYEAIKSNAVNKVMSLEEIQAFISHLKQ